ncbi:hypothetical protein F4804DRAFT_351608 [Jackrogersella minutella]|nr:hypothetical protein F4804DRAFT_351608 [Jackrogersella minutella]
MPDESSGKMPRKGGHQSLRISTDRVDHVRRNMAASSDAIPDSGIEMPGEDRLGNEMAAATSRGQNVAVVEINGVVLTYTLDEITKMGNALAKARAEGDFPRTTASAYDFRAIIEDHCRLVELTRARAGVPRDEWNTTRGVVNLTVDIHRQIRGRDKLTAESTEEQRVRAQVNNMMSGVGAEARLYSIVQHAVTYAIRNGSNDQAATVSGQNMAHMLEGIQGVIRDMAGQGTHNISGVNVEAVLEDIFGMIDFALGQNLGDRVEQMDGQINAVNGQLHTVNGQLHTVNGQIAHLNAIGQHVNAIDGHVHSLGNNLNAMGTLLNSTNGNVVSMTTQIGLLQTIVNMLPRMIAESLEQLLPETLQAAIGPIVTALEDHFGVTIAGHARPSSINPGHGRTYQKKSRTKSFFKKSWNPFRKRGPPKPDF